MPVIVIGADTDHGLAVARALAGRSGEVRAFISDPEAAEQLRNLGAKVAIGDVSDASHIEGAAHEAFSAVLIAECGRDDRERSFADSELALVTAWAAALRGAGVRRIVWVATGWPLPVEIREAAPESAELDGSGMDDAAVGAEVARLDDLATLDPG